MRLHRTAAGSYIYAHPRAGVSSHYRIERGWADAPGTDRRRQTWVLTRVERDGTADILSDHPTLDSARAELERILPPRTSLTP